MPKDRPRADFDKCGLGPAAFEGKSSRLVVLKRDEAVVAKDDDKFKKLIVGKWKWLSGGPYTPVFTDTEFTADGKVMALRAKEDPREVAMYSIKDEYLLLTSPPMKDKDGKMSGKEHKIVIKKLTESEFKTDYFTFERMK